MTVNRYDNEELLTFAQRVLISRAVPEDDARHTAESLIRADLEGYGSHGISRLPVYSRRLAEGRIAASPDVVADRRGSVVLVDGGNGLGQAVAARALRAGIPVAREQGIAAVLISGSNHFGTAAYLCQEAAREKLVSIIMTNSPPGIAPWGGRAAFLGTNPIAFGFPPAEEGEPPVISDLSSSLVARGKIMQAQKAGQPIPEGWAIDAEGRPTTDAGEALKGAILPLGGAKGYALALAVEMLCGILTGASFGPHTGNLYKDGDKPADIGHVILLLSPGNWLDGSTYSSAVAEFIGEIKRSPRTPGTDEIRIPGERRARNAAAALRYGVPLQQHVVAELEETARNAGFPFPAALAFEERDGNPAAQDGKEAKL